MKIIVSYMVVNTKTEIKESHRILVDLSIGCGSCLYEEVKNSAFLRLQILSCWFLFYASSITECLIVYYLAVSH